MAELHEECGVFGAYAKEPANLAGMAYYGLYALGVIETVAAVSGMLLIFALRLLATVYKWNLPAVRTD